MRVTLISYNLMNGGEGRADPLAEVMLASRPDIVGVHEATDISVLRRLSDRLSMDFVYADSTGGCVAVFSRFPIIDSRNDALAHRSTNPMLTATLGIPGRPFICQVNHVKSSAEAERCLSRMARQASPVPDAVCFSTEPPFGHRMVDGKIVSASERVPAQTANPIRQLDWISVNAPRFAADTDVLNITDRLAMYASDHLPAVTAIELA
jgi:hypothetical protein